ncbi:Histidine kinase [Chitinophaga sp. YR573]|uniref:sensor histidine kinase n=1 Tax=Chitinophaga sp. YR573 TaxID=1881040 RepID=UPI0008C645A7|nr:sensor histidine kinase [Chitinophaga sp. YR573]SEW39975.1 Histidine kinase [Chitinophaga sp. YR573]
MKKFWKYYFPTIYGLLIYFTIRLLLDTVTGMKFWHRPWQQNCFEIFVSVLMGYVFIGVQHCLYKYFDAKWQKELSYKRVLKEFGYVFLASFIFQNIFIMPVAIFTDDGAQWYDVVDVNIIPTLYAFIYYGISRSNTFLEAYVNNRLQLEKVVSDQLQAELKFLKSQLHPHFIFNALNTIYFQMDEDVSAAKRSVERFSELLRYQLYDQEQTVPVRREIQYLESFISLQKVRASEKLSLKVEFDSLLNDQQVYPLLFFPLVENAFKYVGGDYKICIKTLLQDDHIVFQIKNDIPDSIPLERVGGIGLENLRRRLELLYRDKHTFNINKTDKDFTVELIIKTA